MTPSRSIAPLLLLVACLLAATACGNKGPLVRPVSEEALEQTEDEIGVEAPASPDAGTQDDDATDAEALPLPPPVESVPADGSGDPQPDAAPEAEDSGTDPASDAPPPDDTGGG